MIAVPASPSRRRLDDRDRRADGGFEIQGAAELLGGLGEFKPVFGDQRLVGGHYRFAGPERGLDRRQRGFARAPHQLDKAIDIGIACKFERSFGPVDPLQVEPALLGLRTRGDRDHTHRSAAARR